MLKRLSDAETDSDVDLDSRSRRMIPDIVADSEVETNRLLMLVQTLKLTRG